MADLRALWTRLIEGLWFIPGAIVLASLLLAVGMVELSAAVDPEALAQWPRVFGAGAEGSRSMLAAIAGSMITVAGVTFSITMVAVTQASSQYTPRILRNFMRDRANQSVLGVFVGNFAYCLVVLRTIRGADDLSFVPRLAVLLGVLLAIVGIAVLIFFVHHIATTLQASEIIARIARETIQTVDRVFPDWLDGEAAAEAARHPGPASPGRDSGGVPVLASATGYIQGVDAKGVVRLARERNLVVTLDRQVGEFVVAGMPFGRIARGGDVADPGVREDDGPAEALIADRFTIGNYRTIDQDPAFGIRQLVDIALKALSPGINDSTTAVTCVDYLGAILVRSAGRRIEGPYRSADEAGRVTAPAPSFGDLLQTAFDEIRQHADGNVSVLARLLATLAMLGRWTPSPGRCALLLEQVALLEETIGRTVPSPHDRRALQEQASRARAA